MKQNTRWIDISQRQLVCSYYVVPELVVCLLITKNYW